MVAAHVFVADLDAPAVGDDDRHHLERVLRLRPGEVVSASDGVGGTRLCMLGGGFALEPTGPVLRDPAPVPSLSVGFSLVKGDRPEWIVQKLTELGVDRILPFVASRTVVRWDGERATRNAGRLRKVAREAAMQSRRSWLPVVDDVRTFADVVEVLAPAGASLASPDGGAPTLTTPSVLVGPEGGWADDELTVDLARVRLGPTVLRTETAAVAAGALLAALRAGLVRPSPGTMTA